MHIIIETIVNFVFIKQINQARYYSREYHDKNIPPRTELKISAPD